MGSPRHGFTDLEENLKCSICLGIFKDPVVLRCSHSFCKDCVELHWHLKVVKECPICRYVTNRSPLKNLALKSVCECFVEEKRRRISTEYEGLLCVVHGLKHELFCTDDQKLVCMKCVSQEHQDHNFCAIKKAAEDHKNKLQNPLKELENKLNTLNSKRITFSHTDTELQSQGQQTEMQIKKEFKMLNHFLIKEEEARISALRDEQKRKTEMIMEKIAEVDRQKTVLSQQIQNINDDLNQDESLFLHNFRETEERLKHTLPEINLGSGAMIDVAKHTRNLRSEVCAKMNGSLVIRESFQRKEIRSSNSEPKY
ncbi:E3 ubiquitin-protein ligase TRIM35-like [Tachysurus fulvidraco]|uniref:E3 ubiquitin-protein ligase TRIM35-like n=1 Tax=Tachysurus fulvidraco TaxID=1234273 RepID=UPI001FEE6AF2|nr:E3 ubiquitin-protein ligase TRIM35-like [Tachysurus fulvidraco]